MAKPPNGKSIEHCVHGTCSCLVMSALYEAHVDCYLGSLHRDVAWKAVAHSDRQHIFGGRVDLRG